MKWNEKLWLIESWQDKRHIHHESDVDHVPPTSGLTDWHQAALSNPHHHELAHDTKEYHKNLPQKESNHVAEYQLDSGLVNRHLRTEEPLNELKQQRVNSLDKVTSNTLKHHTVLYRGMHPDFGKLPVGSTIHDKGFTGTSLEPHAARQFADAEDSNSGPKKYVGRIFLKKGQKGSYLPFSKPNAHDDLKSKTEDLDGSEDEVLLPRNTKYKIIGHSPQPKDPGSRYQTHYINMEAQHPDEENHES
jgi:ADP-ribosyltransferase exoenzyme